MKKYGKKSIWLKLIKVLTRVFKGKKGYIPLFISRGCFDGYKEMLE